MRTLRAASLIVVFLLGACAGDGEEKPEESPLTEAASSVLAADQAFAAAALESGAPAALRKFLDEDALQLPPWTVPLEGREAIANATGASPRLLSWEPRYAEVVESGEWGWSWGDWQAHEPGAGGRRIAQGRYVHLWHKDADGNWKLRTEIRNGDIR